MPGSGISTSEIVKASETMLNPTLEDAVVVTSQEQESDDIITINIKEDELPDQILKAVLLGLADEQSSLKTLRKSDTMKGKDTSSISLKRGTLLKYMSETLLQKQALVGMSDELNLKGPKFREVFKMFLLVISDTFEEVGIPPEYKAMFFQTLSGNLDGWEQKAEKVIKSMNVRKDF